MTHHPNDRIENKGRAVVSQMHPYANMPRFLLPLVLVCHLHSQSASFQWIRQIGGSQGQTVAGLAGDSQGNIYVAGNTTSTDFPTQSALQSHPGGSGLLRIDGPGAQWQNLYQSGLSSTEWISSDPRNPNTIYATSIQGMFRSPDGGATWQTNSYYSGQLGIRDLAFDPNTPVVVYLGTLQSIEKSTDDGL